MSTQQLTPDRVLVGMEGSTALYREDIESALTKLATVPSDEAEHLVAIAGEDERAYAPRDRYTFLETLMQRLDDFLADDEGGYYQMRAYLASHDRSEAVLEIWFHVATPNRIMGGTWFRHLAVGLDDGRIYADMGS